MNKTYTIFLMLLLVAVQAIAGPVGREEALLKAKSFMSSKGMKVATVNLARKALGKTGATSSATDNVAYYVFNAEQDGFVIISGDDRTVPVLGYSERGSFSEENIPTNLKAWLDGYADQIAALDDGAQPARASSVGTAIAPLLKTQWDQGEPYNNECPEYATGYKSATGCTATATAQIMKYHGHPSASTAIPGYTTSTYEFNVPALEATSFDWDNMLDKYEGSTYSDEKAQAVAQLMRYVGQSMTMDYGPESGSSTAGAIKGLVDYLGYDQNTTYRSRANCTIQEWHDLIYNELKNNRPVLYGGQSSGGGHSFVCDGYNGDGLYHINWGWGGYYDGYFSLEVLNPYGGGIGASASGGGYSFQQDCAIGLRPSTGEDATPKYLEGFMLHYENDTLFCNFINYNHTATGFQVAFAQADDDNNILGVITGSNATLGMHYYAQLDLPLSNLSWVANSTYKIIPVSREKGQNEWKPCMTANDYALITTDADNARTVTIYPEANLEVINIAGAETACSNVPSSLQVTIKNNGEQEYRGKVLLQAVFNDNTGIITNEIEGIYIEAGGTVTLDMNPKFKAAGTYTVYFGVAEDMGGSYTVFDKRTLTVNPGTFTGKFNGRYEDGKVKFTYTFINGSDDPVSGNLSFYYYKRSTDNGSWTIQNTYSSVNFTEVSSGYTQVLGEFIPEDAIEGTEYKCVVEYTPTGGEARELVTSDIVAVPITVNVTDACYATYCPVNRSLDFSATADVKAYKATVSGTRVILTEVDVVNKGVGVILCSEGAASEAIPLITDGVTIDETENLMVGVTSDATIYETATIDGASYINYVLANKDGRIAFYRANPAGTNLKAGMAYLRVSADSGARVFSLDSNDDGTTDIDEVVSTPDDDNAYYTLQGLRVAVPTKGLYIHRGKVVMIK